MKRDEILHNNVLVVYYEEFFRILHVHGRDPALSVSYHEPPEAGETVYIDNEIKNHLKYAQERLDIIRRLEKLDNLVESQHSSQLQDAHNLNPLTVLVLF